MSFKSTPRSELAIERDLQNARRILSVGQQPAEEEIRQQFKRIAKANHPDHGGHASVVYTMELLQWAKKILLENLENT